MRSECVGSTVITSVNFGAIATGCVVLPAYFICRSKEVVCGLGIVVLLYSLPTLSQLQLCAANSTLHTYVHVYCNCCTESCLIHNMVALGVVALRLHIDCSVQSQWTVLLVLLKLRPFFVT